MRIYMQTVSPNNFPRYYQLHLGPDLFNGWMLTKEWGAQGSPGRVQKKFFENIEDAEKAFQEIRDKQIKRGYRVVFVEGQAQTQ